MKKTAFLLGLICAFAGSAAFADVFDSLEGITPAQKQNLTRINFNYKQKNNDLEMRIIEYNNKINQLKQDKDKTPEQIELLSGAYERNLETFKAQQKQLEQETDKLYKANMTEEQYLQYRALQMNVQDSFNDFLQK